MNDQQHKLYRELVDEWEQQRLTAVAKSDADFNNPAWLQEALELEHDAAVTARAAQQQLQDELTAVTVERDELQTACNAFEATEAFLIDAAKKVQAERDAARAEVARLREALEFIYPFTSPYGNENIITARKALDEIREAINLALTPTD